MTPTVLGFYLLAGLAVVAALFLVSSRNLLHAVLGLAVASLAVAGLMLTLGAEFMAFVLVLIYVGAVVVLGVFAVMLTGHFSQPVLPPSNELKWLAAVIGLGLTLLITGVVLTHPWPEAVALTVDLKVIGVLLLSDYALPFELVSLLLLAALVGALVIVREREKPKTESSRLENPNRKAGHPGRSRSRG
jgi:NADH:ubiquinone oxidoreductase subunit 6 (subunit J)